MAGTTRSKKQVKHPCPYCDAELSEQYKADKHRQNIVCECGFSTTNFTVDKSFDLSVPVDKRQAHVYGQRAGLDHSDDGDSVGGDAA